MASALVALFLLMLAGVLFEFLWRLVLAALILAPCAAGGIVVGWYVARWSGSALFGWVAAVATAAAIRRTLIQTSMRLMTRDVVVIRHRDW
jgi:hypothetical protein